HKLAKDAGFPDLRFHDLRHTHASLMLAAGEELTVVQQRLGHEKPTTTAAIYAHAIPGRQKEAADRFEELLRGSKKKARATIGRRSGAKTK
ncbi:MAG TPA: tyrosine-type recombinase/integrase, partial [Firmicutes bacterium]|nr:tyrosine-type recombinase/integrase [Bacillota bacterium]